MHRHGLWLQRDARKFHVAKASRDEPLAIRVELLPVEDQSQIGVQQQKGAAAPGLLSSGQPGGRRLGSHARLVTFHRAAGADCSAYWYACWACGSSKSIFAK